jgi:glutamyl-tRNA reductase
MRLEVVGCNHRSAPIAFRERLAFSAADTTRALEQFHLEYPEAEVVLLSTCNRVEFYLATTNGDLPRRDQVAAFWAGFHALEVAEILPCLYLYQEREAATHLFVVAASLDSMVLGEPQILAQVKQAYQQAVEEHRAGPLMHAMFQYALKAARRIASETAIHERRVSIPSVAVADFAQQIFERFDDKRTLVIGAGEMAEETLRYLQNEGAHDVTVVNRSFDRARELAVRWRGRARPWEELLATLAEMDLVISTTGADQAVVSEADFRRVHQSRDGRPLFVLDLAVPRDFAPTIGDLPGVYLYSIDDLRAACERNRRQRDQELPAAMRIVEQEADHFMVDLHARASGPLIRRLQEGWQKPKDDELRRLFNKLPALDDAAREEIRQSFDRLLNKLLHSPLESLRDESRHGIPHALLDALARLFQLKD